MTRGRAVAARVAHNHEVAGASPAPATMKSAPALVLGYFSCVRRLDAAPRGMNVRWTFMFSILAPCAFLDTKMFAQADNYASPAPTTKHKHFGLWEQGVVFNF